MNMPLNLRQLLKHAEASKDAAAWEALARNLLAEKGVAKAPARAKAKPARKAPAIDPATLTLTECRAQGIAPKREKIAGGAYVWVLVTFKNGQRILAGQYPRAGKPGDYSAAIGYARAKLLLAASGGVFMSAKAKCASVASVRPIADLVELEQLRSECFRQRAAFETFLHAPYWDGDVPRGVDHLRAQLDAFRYGKPSEIPAALQPLYRAYRAWCDRPAWWRATYAPATEG